jgi:hypothetical protein
MCQCNPVADDWEARLEGRQPDPLAVEVDAPHFLTARFADADEWAWVVVCTGCAEIRRID